jgi:hypothetical protein
VTAAAAAAGTAALVTLPSALGDVTLVRLYGTTCLESIPSALEHACAKVVNDLSAFKEAKTRVRDGEAYPHQGVMEGTTKAKVPSIVAECEGVHPAARITPMSRRGCFLGFRRRPTTRSTCWSSWSAGGDSQQFSTAHVREIASAGVSPSRERGADLDDNRR